MRSERGARSGGIARARRVHGRRRDARQGRRRSPRRRRSRSRSLRKECRFS
ncbi:hypothetical protein BMAFMH_B0751 [Burkholderia mallei FMH]|nr:hypothetical protein BMAFMH_B0751 [Burkholderia mallei FMH]